MDKPFWQSMTFWGALMLAASLFLKEVFGLDIGDPQVVAGQITDTITKLVEVAGTFLAIFGIRRAIK